MISTELHKHIHPEVAEHLLLLLEPTSTLVGVTGNMIEGQHYEAASQVAKQLIGKLAEFQSFLKELSSQSAAHFEQERAKAEAKPEAPAAETPAPAAPEVPAPQQ